MPCSPPQSPAIQQAGDARATPQAARGATGSRARNVNLAVRDSAGWLRRWNRPALMGVITSLPEEEATMDITPVSPGCLAGIRVLALTKLEAGTPSPGAFAGRGPNFARGKTPRGG